MNDLNLFGRRALMTRAAQLAGGALALRPLDAGAATAKTAKAAAAGGDVAASDSNAIAETTSGKVRGYTRNGIQTFKGIPYGADTGGVARFLPPSKPKPWTGVRSSMQYGQVCPQGPRDGWKVDEVAWLFSWDDGQPGEDCLRANIWTPALDGKKRPVMVWLHGGGFSAGSGQELPSYDGENLARRGDVVVVSVNHRLNVLGYLNLAEWGGEKYASSANVGMLDLVLALEWVRDNIADFGGDPGNVTIFGQSGGGGKVNALMAMPSAQGLFHRAIVQSGSIARMAEPEDAGKLAATVLAELNISTSQLDQLAAVPMDRLTAAAIAGQKKASPPPSGPINFKRLSGRLGWSPVVDGKVLPRHPFDPDAPAISAQVPLMVGTVMNEFVTGMGNPAAFQLSADDLNKRVAGMFPGKSDPIVAAFRKTYPDARPFELLSLISVASIRQSAIDQAALKAAQKAAPAFLYWFCWQTPVLDRRPMAFHCSELAFCFDNVERCANMTTASAEAHDLAAKVSQAWINFARHGDPNHKDLPKWPAFQAGTVPTMIFDSKCEMKNDPDGEARRTVAEA
jgi:para-nitrobenzyl esterase